MKYYYYRFREFCDDFFTEAYYIISELPHLPNCLFSMCPDCHKRTFKYTGVRCFFCVRLGFLVKHKLAIFKNSCVGCGDYDRHYIKFFGSVFCESCWDNPRPWAERQLKELNGEE